MTRKELYAQIVGFKLQDKVKEKYGVNYTNCNNAELLKVINDEINKNVAKSEGVKMQPKPQHSSDKKFETLVNILKERHLLLQSDVTKIMNS
jgi:hypothetical protein